MDAFCSAVVEFSFAPSKLSNLEPFYVSVPCWFPVSLCIKVAWMCALSICWTVQNDYNKRSDSLKQSRSQPICFLRSRPSSGYWLPIHAAGHQLLPPNTKGMITKGNHEKKVYHWQQLVLVCYHWWHKIVISEDAFVVWPQSACLETSDCFVGCVGSQEVYSDQCCHVLKANSSYWVRDHSTVSCCIVRC